MKVLFIHQNFPGQFRHIAAHLARQPGCQVLAIGRDSAPGLPGVELLRYHPHRAASPQTHPYARSFEDAVLHGQQVLRLLLELKSRGYRPDAIVAHPGWGETLYAKDAFPNARLIHFCEYYYQTQGADLGIDPEFPVSIDDEARVRSRNALHLLNLENCDLGITPTHWQYSLHPAAYRDKITIIHEGIDTENLGPDPTATLELPNEQVLRGGIPSSPTWRATSNRIAVFTSSCVSCRKSYVSTRLARWSWWAETTSVMAVGPRMRPIGVRRC